MGHIWSRQNLSLYQKHNLLNTGKNIAKNYQLPEDKAPPWDFHDLDNHIHDVFSGMTTAFGMLEIYE